MNYWTLFDRLSLVFVAAVLSYEGYLFYSLLTGKGW